MREAGSTAYPFTQGARADKRVRGAEMRGWRGMAVYCRGPKEEVRDGTDEGAEGAEPPWPKERGEGSIA